MTFMRGCELRDNSPCFPFTVIFDPASCTVTPEGMRTGFLPIRDMIESHRRVGRAHQFFFERILLHWWAQPTLPVRGHRPPYQIVHNTSPPTPCCLASRPLKMPLFVETRQMPIPCSTLGMFFEPA